MIPELCKSEITVNTRDIRGLEIRQYLVFQKKGVSHMRPVIHSQIYQLLNKIGSEKDSIQFPLASMSSPSSKNIKCSKESHSHV